MQVLRRLWPTIRESTLIAVATQILRTTLGAGRKVFDLKWSGFETRCSLFFREGKPTSRLWPDWTLQHEMRPSELAWEGSITEPV